MTHSSTLDIILTWFAGLALFCMLVFLAYGWIKGFYREREQELRLHRRHRRPSMH